MHRTSTQRLCRSQFNSIQLKSTDKYKIKAFEMNLTTICETKFMTRFVVYFREI